MSKGTRNRWYIPSCGFDKQAFERGFTWLFEGPEIHRVFYTPILDNLIGSRSFENAFGAAASKQLEKSKTYSRDGKTAQYVTSQRPIRMSAPCKFLALWPTDDHLAKIESRYNISDLLVIVWNPVYDIEQWKKNYAPNIFPKYMPPELSEEDLQILAL